jgi:hypothetical protein
MRFKVADIIGFGSVALGGLIYMKAKKKTVGIVLIVEIIYNLTLSENRQKLPMAA